MRILIDTKVLNRGEMSGIPGYARQIITGLLDHGVNHQFTLLSTGLRKEPLPQDWLSQQNITLASSRVPNKLLDAYARLCNQPHWGAKTKNDIIFSPHFNILPIEPLPRVITIHDISFMHHPEFFSRREKFWHWLQNYRKQIQAATHIISVSGYTKADLISSLAVPAEKITVIYPGIDETFQPLPPADPGLFSFLKKYELRQPFILFLGALVPRKNILAIIQAFTIVKQNARLKDYQLVLAGSAGYQSAEILRAARACSERDDIRFFGRIQDRERVYLYNAAHIFVFPSWFEGFGFPPLEAQACSLPVVSSNRTSLPEILGESALLIDPWRTTNLANAIIRLETDHLLRQRLIKEGLNNCRRFRWNQAVKSTLSLIEEVRRSVVR